MQAASRPKYTPEGCFHCGLPVPGAESPRFELDGEMRVFCCTGCESVSRFIHGAGLDDFYRLRAAKSERPGDASIRETLALYDEPLMQSRFVTVVGECCDADLIVEGMTCAACAWLVERAIARVPGVESAHVNFSTGRARVRWRPEVARASDVFAATLDCGCRAWPYEAGRLELVREGERKAMLRRFLVAALGMMQVMMYAVPAYIAGEGEITPDIESLMRWAGLILTTPVIAYSAAPFFRNAWNELRAAHLGVDLPVSLGLAAAFVASVFATLAGSGAVYFDSVTMFVFFVTGARYLERRGLERTGRSLQRMAALVPAFARRLREAPGDEAEVIAAAELRPGDRMLVRPGETVPADGVLASPAATVSEALLSGESRPIARQPGERILGGSVNAGDAFIVRVTHVGSDTVLSAMRRMMEIALAERAPSVELARRASGIFVVFILASAGAAALAWWQVDPSRALWIAVSVLIVTCPCALSLATPAATATALGALARHNVLVGRSGAIAALAGATDFVFDKTGTVTEGRMKLVRVVELSRANASECLAIAAAIGRDSPHPVDQALADSVPSESLPAVAWRMRHAGLGIEAEVEGCMMRLGNAEFCRWLTLSEAPHLAESGSSLVWLADANGWVAAFRIADRVRPEAAAAVRSLQASGAKVHLLSGDDPVVVSLVAKELGTAEAHGAATPARKQAYVQSLQLRGARVAMVGDGINDAPVLAQANVSVAMGGGADLAKVRADAVLVSDDLGDLATSVGIARRTRAVIYENLAWALAYNILVLPLAFTGHVTPLAAAIAMSTSSLVVVANALRIR
jgi:Cu2+-exporting ATPase